MPSELSPLPPKYLQEEEILSQECKNLISSLPKQKGWLASHLYQYQGFWYSARFFQGVISCQKHFQVQDSDIFLVTTPKSGTTWLKAIIFTLMNRTRNRVSIKDHPLINNNPHDLVPFLEIKLYVDKENPDLSEFASPRLFATHIPYSSLPESIRESSSCKIVYLCRDPKDIFVSLWQFTNNLKFQELMESNSIGEVFDMFCMGISLFGPVWDHVLGYWNHSQENSIKVLFLKYEDMKEQPQTNLRRLAKFLKCSFSAEEEKLGVVDDILKLCSFDNLSTLEVNRNGKLSSGEANKAFFRRGAVGDWKNYLTKQMVERLDQINEHKFSMSGLAL